MQLDILFPGRVTFPGFVVHYCNGLRLRVDLHAIYCSAQMYVINISPFIAEVIFGLIVFCEDTSPLQNKCFQRLMAALYF